MDLHLFGPMMFGLVLGIASYSQFKDYTKSIKTSVEHVKIDSLNLNKEIIRPKYAS